MPLPVSAEAETAAPAVKQNNLWVSTGKTFVNRIYTVGLTTCGSALVRIAGATESEGFQKVATHLLINGFVEAITLDRHWQKFRLFVMRYLMKLRSLINILKSMMQK